MKKFILIILCLQLANCSSIKKQTLYSGLAGAILGGVIGSQLGKELSPNEESNKLNQGLGTGAGLLTGAYLGGKIGEALWEDNPENHQLPTLLLPDGPQAVPPSNTPKIKIITPTNPQKIKIATEMPDFLRGKVKEANILTYEIEAYEEETEEGRKIYHEPHKAYEYTFE